MVVRSTIEGAGGAFDMANARCSRTPPETPKGMN
jgi:hypothetical protein